MTMAVERPQQQARAARRKQAGFTLLEVVTTMAATSVILLGIGSAMLVAGRAMPDARNPSAETVAGAEALERMVAELQYAVTVTQRSDRVIQFTTADRNGDTLPDTIRYEWSGAAGDPLTRKFNAEAAVTVLPNVRTFSLSYDLQTTTTTTTTAGGESAEMLLASYDSAPADYADYTIKSGQWYSEYFRPVLPDGTLVWKVTRVRFYAKQSSFLGGETRVQLQTLTAGGLPSGIVLDEQIFRENILPLFYQLQEMTYTQACNLSPQQGLCLVFRWKTDAEACKLLGQDRRVSAANLALAKSTDLGVSWATQSAQSLSFWVYGTVTATGQPQTQTTYYLSAVKLRVKAGTDDQATTQTGVTILNQPEVTP